MSMDRAHTVLGWRPRVDALTALAELLGAMAVGRGAGTPPLRSRESLRHALGGALAGRPPGHGDPY
jgi:hypothetical protein